METVKDLAVLSVLRLDEVGVRAVWFFAVEEAHAVC